MKQYIIVGYGYKRTYCIVEAESINEAFAKFIDYYGCPYPLDYKDVLNMTKDFDTEKFTEFMEQKQYLTVYGLYEISNTIYKKEE